MFVRSGDQHYNLATVASIEVCQDGYVRLYPKLNCSACTAFAGEPAAVVRRYLLEKTLPTHPTSVLPVAEDSTDAPSEALTKAATSYRGPGYATKSEPEHEASQAKRSLERVADAMADVDQTIDGLAEKYGRTWLESVLWLLLDSGTSSLLKK